MAIELAVSIPKEQLLGGGEKPVVISYWKIAGTIIAWHRGRMRITLIGFKSKKERDSGAEPSVVKEYRFKGTQMPAPEDNVVEHTYNLLKAKDEWKDVEDV